MPQPRPHLGRLPRLGHANQSGQVADQQVQRDGVVYWHLDEHQRPGDEPKDGNQASSNECAGNIHRFAINVGHDGVP